MSPRCRPGPHLLDGQLQALPGRVHQRLRASRLTLPTGTVIARVADETLEDRPEVEPDDVAFLQLGPVGDAVDDDVVDRRADDRRIRRQAHRSVALERRLRAAPGQLFLGHRIELRRGRAGLDHLPHHLEDLDDDPVGPVHRSRSRRDS